MQKTGAMELARKFSPPALEGDVLRIGIQVGWWVVASSMLCDKIACL